MEWRVNVIEEYFKMRVGSVTISNPELNELRPYGESVMSEHKAGNTKSQVNIPKLHWLKEQPKSPQGTNTFCPQLVVSNSSVENAWLWAKWILSHSEDHYMIKQVLQTWGDMPLSSLLSLFRENKSDKERLALIGNPESCWLLICSICHGIMWTNCDIH